MDINWHRKPDLILAKLNIDCLVPLRLCSSQPATAVGVAQL